MDTTVGISLLASLCSWQPYVINTDIPPKALQVGANIVENSTTEERSVDFSYVVRAQEKHQTAYYRQYKNRKLAIGFTWTSPLVLLKERYNTETTQQAEILTCDPQSADLMQWVPYPSNKVNINDCLALGVNNSTGQAILLGRAFVTCPDCKDRGVIPVAFMIDLGFAIGVYSDFLVLTEFDLFCSREKSGTKER